MALTTTTLSGAVVVDQNTITVASGTGFAVGNLIRIDDEIMVASGLTVAGVTTGWNVLRGRSGTATRAHASGANVTTGLPSDFGTLGDPQVSTIYPIAGKARQTASISVTGALPLPTPGNDLDVFLNGTTIIAATLANPTKDMDGSRLTIIGNGKAAHTVTYTAGLGNVGATADVITFSATQAGAIQLVASNGFWNGVGMVVGAASVGGPGIG